MEIVDTLVQTIEQFYQIGMVGAVSCACLVILLALFVLTALCDGIITASFIKSARRPVKPEGLRCGD